MNPINLLRVTLLLIFITGAASFANESKVPTCEMFLNGEIKLRIAGFQDFAPVEVGDLVALSTRSGKVNGRIDAVNESGLIIGMWLVPWLGLIQKSSVIREKSIKPKLFKDVSGDLKAAIAMCSGQATLQESLYGVKRIEEIMASKMSVEPDDFLSALRFLKSALTSHFSASIADTIQRNLLFKEGETLSTWEERFGFMDLEKVKSLYSDLTNHQTKH